MNRRIFLGLIALAMSCQIATAQKSIVILYENDAHCGIDGYTKMAGLRIRPMQLPSAVVTSCRAIPLAPSRRDNTSQTSCASWTIMR